MTLVLDRVRGARVFPHHPSPRGPAILHVVDPGPMLQDLGLGDLLAGDALWLIGGDIARYRQFYLASIPAFINALVVMHTPFAPTSLCACLGSDRPDGAKTGWTMCRTIRIPPTELEPLRTLREELHAYAHRASLPWVEPQKIFDGGDYESYVRGAPDTSKLHAVLKEPPHMQYLHMLLCELHRRAPCSATVRMDGECPVITQTSGRELPDAPLGPVMRQYQVGSCTWLMRLVATEPEQLSLEGDREFFYSINVVSLMEFNISVDGGTAPGSVLHEWRPPLHRAAMCGQAEAIRLLLATDTKVNERNQHGKTPLDLALNDDCRTLLRQAGGKTGTELDAEQKPAPAPRKAPENVPVNDGTNP